MASINMQGLDAVSNELKRMRKAQAPAIAKAINDATEYGQQAVVDAIYQRYGFDDRNYINRNVKVDIDAKTLQARIFSRYRASTLTRFKQTRRTRDAKTKPLRQVSAGYSISILRNQPHVFKGAFHFMGRNGNLLMAIRNKGDKWRDIPSSSVAYGPSVAGSFKVVRAQVNPQIAAYLSKQYRQHLS